MIRKINVMLASAILVSPLFGQVGSGGHIWIDTSNSYTNMLIQIVTEHHPEEGSDQGLSQYDTRVSQPSFADEDEERQETAAVLSKLKAAASQRQQQEVAQDLQILIREVELQFRTQDFERAHKVEFQNASEDVFEGLNILLDEQTPPGRRASAVIRIREYAGLEAGYKPITEILSSV